MIILHENLESESEKIARALREVYHIPVNVSFQDLEGMLIPIPSLNGYSGKSLEKIKEGCPEVKEKATLIFTNRDLYWESNENEWVWGCGEDGLTLISTARLKRNDNNPSDRLNIPFHTYLSRLESIAIHEIGHDFIEPQAKHFVDTHGVYLNEDYLEELGLHCPDNRCVMYPSTDIKSPSPDESYMLVGGQKRYDGGLDNALRVMYPDFFCDLCKKSLKTPEKYSN